MKFSAALAATAAFLPILPVLVLALPLNDGSSSQLGGQGEIGITRALYDDAPDESRLIYTGNWTHMSNQGDIVKFGTLSYTPEPNG